MLTSLPASSISLKQLINHSLGQDMLNFWVDKLNPLWTKQPVARIVAREQSAKDTVTLTLKPNWQVVLPQAGQHLMVGAELSGVRVARSYSVSNVPSRSDQICITVKQVEAGRLSTWLCHQAKVGDILHLGQPFGELHWPTQQQPVLLLAAGSGITPMISLLRAYVNDYAAQLLPTKQSVQLHYWVRQADEACFIDELLALQKTQPNFSLHLYLTGQVPHSLQAHEQLGRIHSGQFSQQEDLANSHVIACGSAGFVASAQQILRHQVISWQSEAFSPPALKPLSSHDTVEITLQQQQRILTVPVGKSILQALEAEGIKHPSGCRMGLCNTCACAKLSGSTQHLVSGEEQHQPESALRVCVSTARSALVLDI